MTSIDVRFPIILYYMTIANEIAVEPARLCPPRSLLCLALGRAR